MFRKPITGETVSRDVTTHVFQGEVSLKIDDFYPESYSGFGEQVERAHATLIADGERRHVYICRTVDSYDDPYGSKKRVDVWAYMADSVTFSTESWGERRRYKGSREIINGSTTVDTPWPEIYDWVLDRIYMVL